MADNRTTAQRGYGADHRTEKRRLQRVLEKGQDLHCVATLCLEETRLIPAGTKAKDWHLGHTPDRTAWTGPEHPRCNTSEGAVRGNIARKPAPPRRMRL